MRIQGLAYLTLSLGYHTCVSGHAFLLGCFDDIEKKDIHDFDIVPFEEAPPAAIEMKLANETGFADGNSTRFNYPADAFTDFDVRLKIPQHLSHVQGVEYGIQVKKGDGKFTDKAKRCNGKRSHADAHYKSVQLRVEGTSETVTLLALWSWSSEETYLTEPLTLYLEKSDVVQQEESVGSHEEL